MFKYATALRAAVTFALIVLITTPSTTIAAAPTVIDLTQTGCQFIESENGADHGFQTTSSSDCQTINAETGADRLAAAEPMRLAPGEYIFRVSNRDVPYELGFWLRDKDYDSILDRLTKTSVSGNGLMQGETKEYKVTLAAGEYLYSCPLNPTPDYALIVE